MMSLISHRTKLKIRDAARRFGVEVRPTSFYSRYDLRLKALLDRHKPSILFDVGANLGQFAGQMLDLGHSGRLISFEAIPDVHARLVETARDRGADWMIARNCAVGERDGEIVFHVTENVASSSMLDVTSYSTERWSALRETHAVTVPLRRLDGLLPELGVPADFNNVFLKMDVQGAEDRVLAGAPTVIERASVILCEIQLAPFYQGQADWRAIDALLVARGFMLWDFETVMRSDTTGRLEAADMVYVRADRV